MITDSVVGLIFDVEHGKNSVQEYFDERKEFEVFVSEEEKSVEKIRTFETLVDIQTRI